MQMMPITVNGTLKVVVIHRHYCRLFKSSDKKYLLKFILSFVEINTFNSIKDILFQSSRRGKVSINPTKFELQFGSLMAHCIAPRVSTYARLVDTYLVTILQHVCFQTLEN